MHLKSYSKSGFKRNTRLLALHKKRKTKHPAGFFSSSTVSQGANLILHQTCSQTQWKGKEKNQAKQNMHYINTHPRKTRMDNQYSQYLLFKVTRLNSCTALLSKLHRRARESHKVTMTKHCDLERQNKSWAASQISPSSLYISKPSTCTRVHYRNITLSVWENRIGNSTHASCTIYALFWHTTATSLWVRIF